MGGEVQGINRVNHGCDGHGVNVGILLLDMVGSGIGEAQDGDVFGLYAVGNHVIHAAQDNRTFTGSCSGLYQCQRVGAGDGLLLFQRELDGAFGLYCRVGIQFRQIGLVDRQVIQLVGQQQIQVLFTQNRGDVLGKLGLNGLVNFTIQVQRDGVVLQCAKRHGHFIENHVIRAVVVLHVVEELVEELVNRCLPLFGPVSHALIQTVIGQEVQMRLGVHKVSQVGDFLHIGVECSDGRTGKPGVEAIFGVQLSDAGAGVGAETAFDTVHLLVGRVSVVALSEQEALVTGGEVSGYMRSAGCGVGLFLDNQGVGLHTGIDGDSLVLNGLFGQFGELGCAGQSEHVHALPAGRVQNVDRNTDDGGVAVGESQFLGLQVFDGHSRRVLDVGGIGHLVQDTGLCADAGEFGVEELGRKRPDSGDGESGSGL